jgi:DNA primase
LRSAKGDEAVQLMIEKKKPLFEFAIRQKISKFDLSTIEGRVGAARAAAPVVASIRDASMRPAYVRELAGWVNLDGNEVASIVDSVAKKVRGEAVAELRKDLQEADSPAEPVAGHVEPINLNDPIMRFERQVLEVLLQVPEGVQPEQLIQIVRGGFSHPSHNAVLVAVGSSSASLGQTTWMQTVASACTPELLPLLREIAAQPLPAADPEGLKRYGEGVIARALVNVLAREKADLLAELRRVEPGSAEAARVQQSLIEVEQQRRALQ